MQDIAANLPGRLGKADSTLETDPRADPRIVAAIAAIGGFTPVIEPVTADASYEDCLAYCNAFEEVSAQGNEVLLAMMPEFRSVTATTEVIAGADGNDVKLFVHRPTNVSGPVPCVVHTHGGGMVLMSAEDPGFIRWRSSLAEAGLVVVGVEFRNGGGRLGDHPFPAGLNDCAAAVRWVHEHKADLGVSSIVISGESGGGNLSIATTLKALQEGWVDQIDGVYACCPYISGDYADPPASLLSLRENDGYMLDCSQMAALVKVYDPSGAQAENPLAWPYQAGVDELKGLPPHVVSVNELDPLRDEGLAFYRKLLAAGVSAVGRTVHGTPHAGDLMLPDITPETYQQTLRSLVGFARAL